jgi:hypothetical protein
VTWDELMIIDGNWWLEVKTIQKHRNWGKLEPRERLLRDLVCSEFVNLPLGSHAIFGRLSQSQPQGVIGWCWRGLLAQALVNKVEGMRLEIKIATASSSSTSTLYPYHPGIACTPGRFSSRGGWIRYIDDEGCEIGHSEPLKVIKSWNRVF